MTYQEKADEWLTKNKEIRYAWRVSVERFAKHLDEQEKPKREECEHELIANNECAKCGEKDVRKIMNPLFGRKDVCPAIGCWNRCGKEKCEHYPKPKQEECFKCVGHKCKNKAEYIFEGSSLCEECFEIKKNF